MLTGHGAHAPHGGGPSLYRTPLARRHEALAYIAAVIADAHRRWPGARGGAAG